MLTRRTTFRLYPSKQQTAKLFEWKRLHCYLYNAALADRRDMYKRWGISVDYYGQQNCLPAFKAEWPEFTELGSHALQATLKRVDFAFERFFRGLGGYPKFKGNRYYSGWTYPCKQSWKAQTDGEHGQLKLTNLGEISMRGKARTWGTPTTCTIFYRHGKWYASITVKCEPVRETAGGSIGLDLGCKDAVTFSDGTRKAKPAFIASADKAVKRASKRLRRKRAPNRDKRVRGSRRWRVERQKVSRLQRKVTRQREHWIHELTSNIVSANSLIAGENLNVKGMTAKAKKGKRKKQKAGLNRSILSVGFGMIGQFLDYKSAEAGGFYVESNTRKLKPTQRCAICWELTPKTLAHRVHVCSNSECAHVEDRDVNAAQVNLIDATGRKPALSRRSSASTKCASMKQAGELKRAKSLALKDNGTKTPSFFKVG
ncbi:RNA-guided endonuclease TnpB family protein [cf. Phormidesmis sp. LEGE 11477]|uniref:RNA-guided endonuclease InsQ/TnpB family protein n=1 Tax=cf. Phormidesmis sp. LEGE 11477 TaxID=1828680 RepID=UPI00187EE862|nr:RNA-guided endonuclease TnpB family protein [cf. Phormidesmis sp. LEGE 11477]MBE9064463.1 transposase [cf. Phormidesmis sp. LEGE 11477]